ncbi:VWA domain-containing protein [Candidatus Methylospira mobilis]|uniref:VWA domain-containing protein n=1 Tax=Candidatus Methylospira mobilis TaxID=1808979 RepID=A0A5Q0BHT7_9GAMM|nr:VWA domain-containing protein [Candidatus Methylospira mobilis]QFY41688.1 VWA domain-containing protein [Candidatus Methylospira mobilis]WNV06540.1 VWA domain-containing protein [Candidatus Methylospira mobilis]
MFEFASPWFFLALPLPWLVRRFAPPYSGAARASLRVPFLDELEALPGAETLQPKLSHEWRLWLAVLAWVLLVTASARPQWLGDPVEQAVSGRDLLMAVDLSGSMEIADFKLGNQQVDRLTATKAVAGQFIERRVGDRIGLILFGDHAYLQAPLTFDRKTVHTLLDESAIGLAGEKTAIGDAIGLAVKRLRDNPENQRVLILLTDGANTAGVVSPLQAAELAAREKLKIYSIGVGADVMLVRDFFGTRRVNPSSDLDEDTMRALADKTGGRYFRARDTAELGQIYQLLDELEPAVKEQRSYRPREELFPWFLGVALLIAAGLLQWGAVKT